MKRHGYHYTLGNTTWSGHGFSSRQEAQARFQALIDGWIAEKLPPPKRWWQFWRADVERPCLQKHTF